jgi:hypothetical protein
LIAIRFSILASLISSAVIRAADTDRDVALIVPLPSSGQLVVATAIVLAQIERRVPHAGKCVSDSVRFRLRGGPGTLKDI